ncbi:SMI1/KNR4 family protein [uncultured Kordia sp.]|uniref:SMI1/KNR4 family protein n=1 Tax=uncultured Kordia sp. TaxID=507699 RepID=UPI002622FFED|nr:SMI1/KNR4 family protein [uncultured Kordia sp.]
MPFHVEEEYILQTESELNVVFPTKFKNRMMEVNGGELIIRKHEFELYPFFDKSDRKRISRTCNHIVLETHNAREWNGFPENAVAIGSDGSGNQIILTHNGDGILTDEIYFWDHEEGLINKIAESIQKLSVENNHSFWQKVRSKFNL